MSPAERLAKGLQLESALFVQWLLGELFVLADDFSAGEAALLKASVAQDLRVLRLQETWA